MKTLNFLKTCTLTLADHTIRVFEKGVHQVEAEIADHWFVKGHVEPVAAPEASAVPAASEAAEPAKKTK